MNTKGFTLIEVILVIVLLAIAIPSLLSIASFILEGQVSAIGTTTAMDLAQERMEEIIGDKMNPARGFVYITNANYPAENPVTGWSQYNRSVNIICVSAADLNTAAACTDYKRVQVTVSAVGMGGAVPDAVLVSLVTNY